MGLGLLLLGLLTLPNAAVAQSPVPLPLAATPVALPRVMPKLKHVAMPDAATRTSAQAPEAPQLPVDLPPAVTLEHVAWPNPSSPPAWIQWLGWSDDGHRLAWRQGPEWAQMLPGTPIEIVRLDDRGNVSADTRSYRTSQDRLFSCGDMRRGQSLVVWAIREGRQCARAVDAALMGESQLPY